MSAHRFNAWVGGWCGYGALAEAGRGDWAAFAVMLALCVANSAFAIFSWRQEAPR